MAIGNNRHAGRRKPAFRRDTASRPKLDDTRTLTALVGHCKRGWRMKRLALLDEAVVPDTIGARIVAPDGRALTNRTYRR